MVPCLRGAATSEYQQGSRLKKTCSGWTILISVSWGLINHPLLPPDTWAMPHSVDVADIMEPRANQCQEILVSLVLFPASRRCVLWGCCLEKAGCSVSVPTCNLCSCVTKYSYKKLTKRTKRTPTWRILWFWGVTISTNVFTAQIPNLVFQPAQWKHLLSLHPCKNKNGVKLIN